MLVIVATILFIAGIGVALVILASVTAAGCWSVAKITHARTMGLTLFSSSDCCDHCWFALVVLIAE